MNKLFLSFIIFISSGQLLSSQNLILNVGLNISSMRITYYEMRYSTNTYPVFSPDLMINYEHKINKTISFKPGVSFSRQGKLVAMDIGSGLYYEEKFTINYIDFPFLISYNFDPKLFGGYNLNLNAGPYLGYGFNGLITSDNTAFISEEKLFLGEEAIERNDWGLLFVAGFGYPDNQIALFISIGLKNLAYVGGDYTRFQRLATGINYVSFIDFSPNARRMLKKRLF